jgi:DNA-binding transcriptional MerR regulator
MVVKNAYTTKQVADNLGIGTSTLRKYCLMLEDERLGNYQFERNEKDQRIFYDHDIIALRLLKKMAQDDGVTLENAVKVVGDKARSREEFVSETPEEPETSNVTVADLQRYEDKLDEIVKFTFRQEERMQKLERFNRELLAKLDEQNKYIQETLAQRDEKFIESMREVQETKRLIAAQEEKPRGFLSKLFGGK